MAAGSSISVDDGHAEQPSAARSVASAATRSASRVERAAGRRHGTYASGRDLVIATSPVRAISIRPWGRTIRSKESILSWVPVTSIVSVRRETSTIVGAEDLGELHDLGAVLDRGGDPEQRHLAGDRRVGLHVADLDHVDELVELLRHLVDRVDRAVERERDAGDVRVLGRADRERVDVEPAAAEEARDAGEDARAVLDREARGCACGR